ncbi:methyltransferase domain-containing protein [Kroppenstedtia sanguinis]|uniref:Malonyl-[acyl-carrier protein] O-methyltransferase n=1 Tax=Kroppenstedtia sanguinis TaxID=1380684 RepID=A0ABW4CCF9_9BACL
MRLEKKRIALTFNRQAEVYDRHAVVQQRMAHRIIQTLEENRVEARSILEVGCGTGYLTQLLSEYFPDTGLVGMDLSPKMAATAMERTGGPVRYWVGDVEEDPLGEECYDLIAANAVIHWLQNPEITLQRLVDALRPGGFLILSAFGPDTLQELAWIYDAVEKEMGLPPSRQVGAFHSEREWIRRLEQAGISSPRFLQCWQRLPHSSAKDLLTAVRSMGAGAARIREHSVSPVQEKGMIREVLQRYDRMWRDKEGVYATFQLIQVYGWKGIQYPMAQK